MSNFPTSFDDDSTLPPVNDNITEIGSDAINAVRDAVFNIETEIGIGASGSTGSIANRLAVSIQADGYIKPSSLTALGLVTLPITQNQIATNANIPESKLYLDHGTQSLFNFITNVGADAQLAIGWISATGIKLEPHVIGALYRHSLDHIDVSTFPSQLFKNKFDILRDNANSYNLLKDINTDLIDHQKADGSLAGPTPSIVTTYSGLNYKSNYAHTGSGIYVDSSRFSTIPQTAQDVQSIAEFIDNSSIFLYGTRIQNLYSNGVSRSSRSSSLRSDGYGDSVVSATSAIAYLFNTGIATSPVDDIDHGDDIVEFKPSSLSMSSNSFDADFAKVRVGDILHINYGTAETQFVIKEKRYIQSGGTKKYTVRIAGRNLFYSATASARIDRPLFNNNKFGVLSVAAANNSFSVIPSLIVAEPRGAMAIGSGFNADQFDATHNLLYLALYPTGYPQDGYTILPPIDVTGNRGATPGKYTLESIVQATNDSFRKPGYNYRFTAFAYQGEFGIMIADSYKNASFSILDAVVKSDGSVDVLGTNVAFGNNVVGIFSTGHLTPLDPLGFGITGSNVASPPFMSSYGSAEASQSPAKIFRPLKRNNYYVDGSEKEKLDIEQSQFLDGYGDGYWLAKIQSQNIFPGSVGVTGRVETTYRVSADLTTSSLKIGKTIVVQPFAVGSLFDSGRFTIKDLVCSCGTGSYTDITVYDAVHGTGLSPYSVLAPSDGYVAVYFGSDSVSFNQESSTDNNSISPFKRHFEVYVDKNGKTFTHERARMNIGGGPITVNGDTQLFTNSELAKLDILNVSSKLRGYKFGSVNKITVHVNQYTTTFGNEGVLDGYLASYNGVNLTQIGPVFTGKKGKPIRMYDKTNVDFVEAIFDVNTSVSSFTNANIDFQLFPTLSLDEELLLLATCQVNNVTNSVNLIKDKREFGNTSEKDFTTSALNYISSGDKNLHSNGVIKGFDLVTEKPLDWQVSQPINPIDGQIRILGGTTLVNGKFIEVNDQTVNIPTLKEIFTGADWLLTNYYDINWAICVNDRGDYQSIPLLDFDVSVPTPSNVVRTMSVFNIVNGLTYSIDATTFSDLINKRKDLTVLYLANSIVTTTSPGVTSTIILSVTDARKYVNDADSNLPLKLTSAESQGNFKSAESIFTWIKYNNNFNGKAIVKGASIYTNGNINIPISLDFANSVVIDGENNATITFNKPVTIGSNVTLKDLNVIFNQGITVSSGATNVLFDNCTIQYNESSIHLPSSGNIFSFANGNNVKIKDSSFDINYNAGVYASGGNVFNLSGVTEFSFENSSVDVSFELLTNSNYPGNIFKIVNSPSVKITGSYFTGNFNKFVDVSSNYFSVKDSFVTSTYDPNLNSPADLSYSASNLVNSGQGYIYSNVSAVTDGITIDNVYFTYQPSSSAFSSDRFSFINFELSTINSVLSNLVIKNCKFVNSSATGSYDDIRPAISIINIAPTSIATTQQPILSNAFIENNNCNKNQSIILTSKTVNSTLTGVMVYPGIVAQNVIVSKNICGAIGYWVSSGIKTVNFGNVNAFSDKSNSLVIRNNTCHYIYNSDHAGKYWVPSKTVSAVKSNYSLYPSGDVVISENKTNWIHTGIAYEENSSLMICKNSLVAYDEQYLSQYGDTSSIATGYFGYAILALSNKYVSSRAQVPGEGNDSNVIISDNTIGAGYWYSASANPITYKYSQGYIGCQSSNIIQNNICKGIVDGNDSNCILVGGLNNKVIGNSLYRNGAGVYSYISFSYDGWNGLGSSGIVTDNYFDSPYTGGNISENTINFADDSLATNLKIWIVERNKNQTGYLSLSLNDSFDVNISPSTYGAGAYGLNTTINYPQTPGSIITPNRSQLMHIVGTNASDLGFLIQKDLGRLLPINVTITELKIGIRNFDGALTGNSSITIGINTYYNVNDAVNPSINLDYISNSGINPGRDTMVLNDSVAQANSSINGIALPVSPTTKYLKIDLINPSDISSNYVSGVNRSISLSMAVGIVASTSSGYNIYLSPISVKYRW